MRAEDLSRRERQVMDFLYARGRATATEILDALPQAPGYSAVRGLLRVLEQKGHVTRSGRSGRAIVYKPMMGRAQAGRTAVRRLLRTFFGGSVEDGVAALLNARERPPTDAELTRLTELVRRARGAAK